MTTVGRGANITLDASFYEYAGGDLVDPTSVSLSILFDAATVAGPFTYAASQVTRVSLGQYRYIWAVPTGASLGNHTARWTAVINSANATGDETFEVVSAGSVVAGDLVTYASITETATYTGVTVTQTTLEQAQGLIEMFTNRTASASEALDVTDRDLHWLKVAVAYQAAYMTTNTSTFTQQNLKQISQGDLMLTFNGSGSNSALGSLIAPLARKALERVTWARVRSIRIGSDLVHNVDLPETEQLSLDEESSDWQSI